ncbi:hypothetical protein M9H77_29897 [Catharanthus roseus]|uniref:Uncharacterized protein n=1 Tax=Catharanthus roseus TaxID=4058 RepID=A0ACB9ZWR5_CATRO|nr:hypothetical protein M9H77_29897 [Catharanthus roseus]
MQQFQKFSLNGSEKLSIKVAELDFRARLEEYGLCCVGRFIWAKTMNVNAYRSVICQDADYDFESLLMACPFNFHIAHLYRLTNSSKFQIKQDKEDKKIFQFRADVVTKPPIRRVFVLETPSNVEVVGLVQKLFVEVSNASSKAVKEVTPTKKQNTGRGLLCPKAYASSKSSRTRCYVLHDICLLLCLTKWYPNVTILPLSWYSVGRPAFCLSFYLCSEGFLVLLHSAEEGGTVRGFFLEEGLLFHISSLLIIHYLLTQISHKQHN